MYNHKNFVVRVCVCGIVESSLANGRYKCDFIVALIKTNVKIAKHQWNYMENESNEYKINKLVGCV